MDFARATTITIAHLDFMDLVSGRSGNPMAEAEIPEMLRQNIKSGGTVIITDVEGKQACKLVLSSEGKFIFAKIA